MSIGLWMVFLFVVNVMLRTAPTAATIFAVVYISWALYTWVAPSLIRRWLRWRGF